MRIDQTNATSYQEVVRRTPTAARQEDTVNFTSDLLSLSGSFSHLQRAALTGQGSAVAALKEAYRSGSYRPDAERLSRKMIDRAFESR
jgi:anti-sigma28 factor (negative regulator of flagellin synthesis)